VNRRRVLRVLVHGLAGLTAGALGSRLVRAADTSQRVVRLGIVVPASRAPAESAFWERMRELGWVEGQNLVVEWHFAEGHVDRLPALMVEVVGHNVDVIMTGSTPGAIAAKNATSTIPIVAIAMGDPVRSGIVQSLAHPGGNLTGMSMGYFEGIASKWLELLQETVPRLSTVAVMVNPGVVAHRDLAKELEVVAPKRRLKVQIIEAREAEELDGAFEQARRQAQAVLVLSSPMAYQNRIRITSLAANHRLPVMYTERIYVDAGGLMSYAVDPIEMFRHAADLVDKILRGAKPADLPVEQPTQYLLVVNLKAAKALGLAIPQSILLQANEVLR
jgi:putative ABC transport system substrate-binding protein